MAAAGGLLVLMGCPGRLEDPERFMCNAETDIFEVTCAQAACHDAMSMMNGLDLQSPGIAMRIKNGTSSSACMSVPLTTLIPKKLTATPPCGSQMPVGAPLTADQVSCVDEYIAKLLDGGSP
jgi:hypothetical protein